MIWFHIILWICVGMYSCLFIIMIMFDLIQYLQSIQKTVDVVKEFQYWKFPNKEISLNEATHLISKFCQETSNGKSRLYYEQNVIQQIETIPLNSNSFTKSFIDQEINGHAWLLKNVNSDILFTIHKSLDHDETHKITLESNSNQQTLFVICSSPMIGYTIELDKNRLVSSMIHFLF